MVVNMSSEAIYSKGPISVYRRQLKVVGNAQPTKNQITAVAKDVLGMRDAGAWALGDLALIAEASGAEDALNDVVEQVVRDAQWIRKCKYVAHDIAPEMRTHDLWWTFYNAVRTFPEEVRKRFLDLAESEHWSLDEFKKHLREVRHNVRTELQKFPAGKFGFVYADPPWEYEGGTTDPSRQISNQYRTMELDEIRDLRDADGRGVADLCAPDCILYLWATSPKLEEALSVMAAWGFNYRSSMVWEKDLAGMGFWSRVRHELLLIGVKGDVIPPHESKRPDSIIVAPRGEHSVKPPAVYDLIEELFPKLPKIELFSRSEREGWVMWGDQAPAPRTDVIERTSDLDAPGDVDPETGDVAEAGAVQEARDEEIKPDENPALAKPKRVRDRSKAGIAAAKERAEAKKAAAVKPRLVKKPKAEANAVH
jgi:N6-adenosine-specific RNA methylase IME4